jgi:hypothetical protein
MFSRSQNVAKGCRNSEVATDDVMLIRSQQVWRNVVSRLRGFTRQKLNHSIYTQKKT